MNFDKDKKSSPFSLNPSNNNNSPFSLQPSGQDKKLPNSLSSAAKPNLGALDSNNNNSSPFSLSSINSNTNNKPSPFSLQTNNANPLLNQLNNTTEKPSLFTLQSNNVTKPLLNNNTINNNDNSKTTSPFTLNSNTNNSNSSPFSLSTNSDKKLISPFSLSNANANASSPFTLHQNNSNLGKPTLINNINNNQNNTQNASSSPFSLSNPPTVFNSNLGPTAEKKSSPFSLQNNSQPLSSMINDAKPTLFTSHSSLNTNNIIDSVSSIKTNDTEKISKNNNDNDLTKKPNQNTIASSIFASFNIPSNEKLDKNHGHQNDNLIAKPSGFAKFLLDIDEEEDENSNKKGNTKVLSPTMIKSKKDGDNLLKSPLSPNVLLDLDEESTNKEAIEKLNEIHKLFRNTSPYYLLNFIDWEEEEGYDEEEDYLHEEEIEERTGKNEAEIESEEKVQSSENNNKKEAKTSHKLFKFDTPSPDDIVIMSREKGKKDVRDANVRSNQYMEKKNENNTQQKMNQSNVEVSSDHVIRIGASPSTSKDNLLNSSSRTSSRSSLPNADEARDKEKQNPDGFNFKYRHAVLANAFPPEDKLFETEEEKAENDYYKYQTFEDENAKIVGTYYPSIPDPIPTKYNSVYYHKIDLEKELEKRQEDHYREALHITCLGPLKSGKSTLLGRIYEELILKPSGSLREVKKIEKELQRRNQSLEKRYAWLMDESKIEKERNTTLGITTDFSVNYKNREWVIYDTPGHTDYISTTISELYNTDIILLMMDASSENINNECDIAIIKDYLFLCKCIGIQNVLVVINKMETVKYSETIYQKLLVKIKKIVEQFKFKSDHVHYVPCDGLNAENIFEKSTNPLMAWYQGKSIFDYLDELGTNKNDEEKEDTDTKSILDTPFRMVVKDYMRENGISGSSVTVEGRLSSGIVQVGENLFTTPNYDVPFVRAIECNGQLVKYAVAGDYVRIGLGNIDISKISKDTILCSVDHPIKLVNKFKAQILVNSSNIPIIKGTNAIMYINNNQESVYIKKIKMKKVKLDNHKIGYKRTTIIPKNTVAEVIIQLHDKRRIPLQTYNNLRHFGRFILQHDSEIIASGVVLELL